MSGSLKIRVLEREIYRGKVNLHGRIWFDFGGNGFPRRDWEDFPVRVLSGLADALLQIQREGEGSEQIVDFYDGPYEMRLEKAGREVRVLAFDRGLDRALHRASVSFAHLVAELHRAADSVLDRCTSQNWTTEDTERLGELVGRLRRLTES